MNSETIIGKVLNKIYKLKTVVFGTEDFWNTFASICYYVNKYHIYNEQYIKSESEEPPYLYDILSTGCQLPYADYSIEKYDDTLEKDINNIIELFPNCIKYSNGRLRCRNKVTPLAIACFNKNIPISIIESLLKLGADPNSIIEVNGDYVKLIKDLEHIDSSRYIQIKNLFEKYDK